MAVMGNNPSSFKTCGMDCPVENINWNDAQEFSRKLSQKTGKNYRLPSEAEWEYAARAGSSGRWSFGDDESQLGDFAWFNRAWSNRNSGATMHTVAQKRPNAFGLYDMHGNAWEWVQDTWHSDYKGAPGDGSAWVYGGDQARRVLRGGAWNGIPGFLRSAYRSHDAPDYRTVGTGMRIARSITDHASVSAAPPISVTRVPPPPIPPAPRVATAAKMDVSTCAKPSYPNAVLRANIGGVTKLRFSIDALGKVNSTTIVKSSGESTDHKLLDQTAAETLSKCMFIPGVDSNGVAFGSSSNVDYVWKIEPQDPTILRNTCENPEYPAASLRADATGTSKIRFTVDATGTVSKAEIEVSSGASREHRLLDRTAVEALSKCRFKPGIDEQGKPIGGTTRVSYVWKTD